MKLKFTKDIREDNDYVYLNDVNGIDLFCEDSEATEIYIDDFVCNVKMSDQKLLVATILNKLRLNGEVIVTFYDAELIAHGLGTGSVSLEDFNDMVGGRSSVTTREKVAQILEELGITIQSVAFLSNNMVIISGVRNEV